MRTRTVDFLVTAASGRPLAAFDTPDAARSFCNERSERKVPTRLFRVETIREELR